MGNVLRFPDFPHSVEDSPVSMEQAQGLMCDAAALLAGGGEIEQEVAWLLEDLAEFLAERALKPGGGVCQDTLP